MQTGWKGKNPCLWSVCVALMLPLLFSTAARAHPPCGTFQAEDTGSCADQAQLTLTLTSLSLRNGAGDVFLLNDQPMAVDLSAGTANQIVADYVSGAPIWPGLYEAALLTLSPQINIAGETQTADGRICRSVDLTDPNDLPGTPGEAKEMLVPISDPGASGLFSSPGLTASLADNGDILLTIGTEDDLPIAITAGSAVHFDLSIHQPQIVWMFDLPTPETGCTGIHDFKIDIQADFSIK